MKFIPEKLKNIFKRSAAKDAAAPAPSLDQAAAPAPVSAEALAQAAEQLKLAEKQERTARYQASRLAALGKYKKAEGYYQFNLDIAQPAGVTVKGQKMFMVTSREADLYLALMTAQPLAGLATMASSFRETLEKNTGMKNPKIYFRLRQSSHHIDADNDFIGLPATPQFQLVVVPEGCAWKPENASSPRKTPAETCAILRTPIIPPETPAMAQKPAVKPKPPAAG
ncbi:MAG: hypothetical protein PW788_00495 [Micavibrio sp.]|nr:hypothetical protein [Micavibrio sp.]